MDTDVTVAIPSIPARGDQLVEAIQSVLAQTHPVDAVAVAFDTDRFGSGPTRTTAMRMARTTWVAFLDDDDVFLPHHLATCLAAAEESGADVIIPWFDVAGGGDPFPQHRGRQVTPGAMHSFPVTCLVRADVIGPHCFPAYHPDGWGGDDFPFWNALDVHAGATFHAIPDVTWVWKHHGKNCSGLVEHRLRIYGA